MIVRIVCMCGEVTELAEPQAQRLMNCPACGAPLQKSAAHREKAENFFDAPLLSSPNWLLAGWHFLMGVGLLKAAALLVAFVTPALDAVHPMVIAASLLIASGLWLATGFALLAQLRWSMTAAKLLNAAGALLAILVIAAFVAHLMMVGPVALTDPAFYLAVGPMLLIGPICVGVLLRLEGSRQSLNLWRA